VTISYTCINCGLVVVLTEPTEDESEKKSCLCESSLTQTQDSLDAGV
jgi:hypothetical protein